MDDRNTEILKETARAMDVDINTIIQPTTQERGQTVAIATTTQKLSWFDTEDGYVIVGTTDRREADTLHDQLVEDHLAGYEHMEESKAVNLNPPQLIYIRPDYMNVDDEDTQLDIDPATGEKITPENGVPALFYNCN